MNYNVGITVKATFLYKVLLNLIPILLYFKLIPLKNANSIINKFLKDGRLFKFRVDDGKWEKLKIDEEIELCEGGVHE